MRRFPCVIAFCAMTGLGGGAHAAENEGKHLFILSGQSNMEGVKPDVSFTPVVSEKFGSDRVIVVKDAESGQPIRRWYKQWRPANGEEFEGAGDLYDRLIAKVRSAIEGETIQTVTFCWMQGERDARMEWGEVYADSLKGLIQQLRDDLGRPGMNVVIGRINDFDLKNEKYPHWTMVREALAEVADSDPRAVWIDTDDLNDGMGWEGKQFVNDLHCCLEGFNTLGRRFAEESIALIEQDGSEAE